MKVATNSWQKIITTSRKLKEDALMLGDAEGNKEAVDAAEQPVV